MMALAASGAAALSVDEAAATPEGVVWSLTEQASEGVLSAVPEDHGAWLVMDEGEATGNGGCSGYTGTYTLDGSALAFDALEFRMGQVCPDDVAATQATFGQNLLAAAAWAVDGEQLLLSGADGAVLLVFVASPQSAPLGVWTVIELSDGEGGTVAVAQQTYVSATFMSSNDLRGFDGCKDYLAPYEVDGSAITIGELVNPAALPCEAEATERSEAYASAVAAAVAWSVDEEADQLQLLDAAGATLVRYQRAD
jgi:heat shock protein HslJ